MVQRRLSAYVRFLRDMKGKFFHLTKVIRQKGIGFRLFWVFWGAKIYFDKRGQKLCPSEVVGVSMKILTPDEVRFLTGKKHSNAQVRELNHMGIPFNQRTNGSVVVCDVDVPLTLTKYTKETRFTLNG